MRFVLPTILLLGACQQQPADEPIGQPSANEAAPVVAPPQTPAKPVDRKVSRFTTGGIEKCRLVDKNEEEGGYFRHRCPGVGGYDYEVVESDLRQNLVVIRPDGKRDDIALSPVAGGGGFSVLGPTIEWRGDAGQPPRTMTVRFNVNEDPDPNVPDRSYLVVIRLATLACPVAAVPPGPSQSDRARAVADAATLPTCIGG